MLVVCVVCDGFDLFGYFAYFVVGVFFGVFWSVCFFLVFKFVTGLWSSLGVDIWFLLY